MLCMGFPINIKPMGVCHTFLRKVLQVLLKSACPYLFQAFRIRDLSAVRIIFAEVECSHHLRLFRSAVPHEMNDNHRSLDTFAPHLIHPGVVDAITAGAFLKPATECATRGECLNGSPDLLFPRWIWCQTRLLSLDADHR